MKYVITLLLLFICSCEMKGSSNLNTQIQRFGRYEIQNYVLEIKEDKNQCVVAQLVNADGKVLIDDFTGASVYQKRFYLWEEKRSILWFFSSDIGGHKWTKQGDDKFVTSDIQSADAQGMPLEVWCGLPGTVQDEWRSQRQQ